MTGNLLLISASVTGETGRQYNAHWQKLQSKQSHLTFQLQCVTKS